MPPEAEREADMGIMFAPWWIQAVEALGCAAVIVAHATGWLYHEK
jgi:hypothetical protein